MIIYKDSSAVFDLLENSRILLVQIILLQAKAGGIASFMHVKNYIFMSNIMYYFIITYYIIITNMKSFEDRLDSIIVVEKRD